MAAGMTQEQIDAIEVRGKPPEIKWHQQGGIELPETWNLDSPVRLRRADGVTVNLVGIPKPCWEAASPTWGKFGSHGGQIASVCFILGVEFTPLEVIQIVDKKWPLPPWIPRTNYLQKALGE